MTMVYSDFAISTYLLREIGKSNDPSTSLRSAPRSAF